jgi:RNA polymerase sigma factor (sigma-70 family)
MNAVSFGESFPQVLDAAKVGAEWAWAQLWDSLAGPLTGYARARGAPDPEDVTADVFAEVARRIGSFGGHEADFRSWAFTIAHSRIVDRLRAADRRQTETLPAGFERPDADADPARVYEAAEQRALELLSSLTPEQAEVVALRILGDLSIDQVAEVTGRNANAVKQLQFRALQALRRNLGEAVTK